MWFFVKQTKSKTMFEKERQIINNQEGKFHKNIIDNSDKDDVK